jgi:hypothetical protein
MSGYRGSRVGRRLSIVAQSDILESNRSTAQRLSFGSLPNSVQCEAPLLEFKFVYMADSIRFAPLWRGEDNHRAVWPGSAWTWRQSRAIN